MPIWPEVLRNLSTGYQYVQYRGKTYGLTKTIFNQGRSIKLYAEELGGNDFISLNYYQTARGDVLKPCEMPVQKVIDFLETAKLAS